MLRRYQDLVELVAYLAGKYDAKDKAEKGERSPTAAQRYPNAYSAGYWEHYSKKVQR